jgi:glycosyltransferase involved in cell wall biosynthesis
MKAAPFFSIIIPTYNRADLLGVAIESVLKQTFTDWELLIVDDGSTDNTAEVVKGFADARIKYIYQTNAERSAARNNGIAQSTGRYICFLDSDDYYLPDRLALLYNEMARRQWPVGMFYTGLLLEKEGRVSEANIDYTENENVYDNIASHTIHSQQACISSVVLSEFRFDPRFRISEDMELWLRIASKYPVIYLEDQFTIVVVEHDNRTVNVMRFNWGPEQVGLFRHIFADEHSGTKISPQIKRHLVAGAFHGIAHYYIYQGERFAAAKALIRAMFADPGSAWFKLRVNVFIKLVTLASMERVKAVIDYN